MLTPEEHTAWDAYVAEMAARGVEVDLRDLLDALVALGDTPEGQLMADALGVGTVPLTELAQRLTLQTRRVVQTGHAPPPSAGAPRRSTAADVS